MHSDLSPTISRRALLLGGTAVAASALFPGIPRAAPVEPKVIELSAAPGRVSLVGSPDTETNVWCYGNRIPGPDIRLRQGEPVRLVVRNQLPEDTTVHWHGIRLPNAMDGVPGLTQPPIKPGEAFTYEFTPPDAGTFWYHPHADSLQQLGRGLAGALIIEEPEPVPVDRDLVWVLSDWRLRSNAQIAPGFGNGMEAAMSGRVGNTVTVNGVVSEDEPVRAGERVRLRLVNTSLARIMALRFEGHRPTIVAIDGQPCEPHEPDNGRLLLAPAMRVDLILDMQGEPGRRYRVVDDFYDDLSYWLTQTRLQRRAAAPRASTRFTAPFAAQSVARAGPDQRRTARTPAAGRHDGWRRHDGDGRNDGHGQPSQLVHQWSFDDRRRSRWDAAAAYAAARTKLRAVDA